MSALHEAARRVVSAWVSTRPAWIEQCNEAVLALDEALKAQPEPAQEPVAWTDALKDAFFEGFTAVQTYNDTWLNSPEEAWRDYKPPNIAPQPQRPPVTKGLPRKLPEDNDHGDWDRIDALEASLQEHMAEIHRLRAALARPSPATLFDARGSLGEPIV